MSEKDGKRVLSPAEKAEADSLTNKQWLYIIGRSAERGNGEKKGRPDVILTVAERILSDIAAIATVIALGVAVFQISVGNWQFDRSGPRFSWFDTGLVSYTTEATLPDGLSGTGEVQAIVVRTRGAPGTRSWAWTGPATGMRWSCARRSSTRRTHASAGSGISADPVMRPAPVASCRRSSCRRARHGSRGVPSIVRSPGGLVRPGFCGRRGARARRSVRPGLGPGRGRGAACPRGRG